MTVHSRSGLVTWANVDNDDDGNVYGYAACYWMTPIRDAGLVSQVGAKELQRNNDSTSAYWECKGEGGKMAGGEEKIMFST